MNEQTERADDGARGPAAATSSPPPAWSRSWPRARGATAPPRPRSSRSSSESMHRRPSSRPPERSSTGCAPSARGGSGSSPRISQSSRGSSSRTSRTRESRSRTRSASRCPTTEPWRRSTRTSSQQHWRRLDLRGCDALVSRPRADALARRARGGGAPQRAADGVRRNGHHVGNPACARPRADRSGCGSAPSRCTRTRRVEGSSPDRKRAQTVPSTRCPRVCRAA